MRLRSPAALASALAMAAALVPEPSAGAAGAQAASQRITVERLKALTSTSNEPSGDAFGGPREDLGRLIDAMVQDASLVSPTYLFLASKTAFNLGRLEDAAFLFYGAQLRAAFDFERYDVARQADGNNAATYLGFLRQTIGMSVNPAIMREPAMFNAVVKRLEKWEIVPSRDAFYPEFPANTKLKLPSEKWPDTAAGIKKNFMSVFGRQARLLNDKEYFEAFRFVQAMNFGDVPSTPENRARFDKSMAAMEAAEKRLFPEPPVTTSKPQPLKPGVVRAGQRVPVPKVLRRVEPEFSSGQDGYVTMEVTIGPEGTVNDVHVLTGTTALIPAAIKAVRQWLFEVSRIDGRPVSVLYTATVTTR